MQPPHALAGFDIPAAVDGEDEREGGGEGGDRSTRHLLDDVALDRLDAHAARLQVGDATVQLLRLAGHLQHDPALLPGDVGAADVGDDRVVLCRGTLPLVLSMIGG